MLKNSTLSKLNILEKLQPLSIKMPPIKNHQILIANMIKSFDSPTKLYDYPQIDLGKIQNEFLEFEHNLNCVGSSKLKNDITEMESVFSLELQVSDSKIKLHFLSYSIIKDSNIIATLIHALNTFCNLVPYHYHDLTIYILLDDNRRNLPNEELLINLNYAQKIEYSQQLSSAFTVSGVSSNSEKFVMLTKKEEMIKLLYHEMVHASNLDVLLRNNKIKSTWDIENKFFNLSEAYTETISVVLNVLYHSIRLNIHSQNNTSSIFLNMLYNEIMYSTFISAKLLHFYGYNADNLETFFTNRSRLLWSPIACWEYIIIRTIFLRNIDKLFDIWTLDQNFNLRVTNNNINDIISIFELDDSFIKDLKKMIPMANQTQSLSYTLYELDLE